MSKPDFYSSITFGGPTSPPPQPQINNVLSVNDQSQGAVWITPEQIAEANAVEKGKRLNVRPQVDVNAPSRHVVEFDNQVDAYTSDDRAIARQRQQLEARQVAMYDPITKLLLPGYSQHDARVLGLQIDNINRASMAQVNIRENYEARKLQEANSPDGSLHELAQRADLTHQAFNTAVKVDEATGISTVTLSARRKGPLEIGRP